MLDSILITNIGNILVHKNSVLLIKFGKCHIYTIEQLLALVVLYQSGSPLVVH